MMSGLIIFCFCRLSKALQDVSPARISPARISPCQMDHRQSHRDQDAQNGQSESYQAGAGPLPAQGEPLGD